MQFCSVENFPLSDLTPLGVSMTPKYNSFTFSINMATSVKVRLAAQTNSKTSPTL